MKDEYKIDYELTLEDFKVQRKIFDKGCTWNIGDHRL